VFLKLPPQVFPTLAAALASSPTVSVLASFIAKDPKLAAAAADPTTNITLLAPVNKVGPKGRAYLLGHYWMLALLGVEGNCSFGFGLDLRAVAPAYTGP
jgi:hypothetical protein